MKSLETHPEILRYYKLMLEILEKNKSPILSEFKKKVEEKDVFDFYMWISDLQKQNLLPPEIDKPLTNLYGSIR